MESLINLEPISQSQIAKHSKSSPAVAMALLELRNPDGSVWIDQVGLCEKTGLNRQTVKNGVKALTAGHWIIPNPKRCPHILFLNPLILTRFGLNAGRAE